MSRARPGLRDLLASPANLAAFGFGAGLAPFAPGTFGTLVGLPLFWLLSDLPVTVYLGVVAATAVVGIPICAAAARHLQTHDHPAIVWDEIAGVLLTLTAVPADWIWVTVGFLLFRFFDILKPWPIRWLDRQVHGGLGIMLDDLLAGVFAAIVLQAILAVAGPGG